MSSSTSLRRRVGEIYNGPGITTTTTISVLGGTLVATGFDGWLWALGGVVLLALGLVVLRVAALRRRESPP